MLRIHGQPRAVALVGAFLKKPRSRAFLLHGPTGTGKTTTAHYLADSLGVDRSACGGFLEIASGEQSAEAVRDLSRSFRLRPMFGTWRAVVVNECDRMSPAAETIWLDVLEHLPPNVVIVFTTNCIDKLSQRFCDRCDTIEYMASAAEVAKFSRATWERIRPGEKYPARIVDSLTRSDASPSYRQALQAVRQAAELVDIDDSPAAPGIAPKTAPEPQAGGIPHPGKAKRRETRPAAPRSLFGLLFGWLFRPVF